MNLIYNKIKMWLVLNGVESIVLFIVGIVLLMVGFKVLGGISIGFFVCKNYELIKKSVIDYLIKKGWMLKKEEK